MQDNTSFGLFFKLVGIIVAIFFAILLIPIVLVFIFSVLPKLLGIFLICLVLGWIGMSIYNHLTKDQQ